MIPHKIGPGQPYLTIPQIFENIALDYTPAGLWMWKQAHKRHEGEDPGMLMGAYCSWSRNCWVCLSWIARNRELQDIFNAGRYAGHEEKDRARRLREQMSSDCRDFNGWCSFDYRCDGGPMPSCHYHNRLYRAEFADSLELFAEELRGMYPISVQSMDAAVEELRS